MSLSPPPPLNINPNKMRGHTRSLNREREGATVAAAPCILGKGIEMRLHTRFAPRSRLPVALKIPLVPPSHTPCISPAQDRTHSWRSMASS